MRLIAVTNHKGGSAKTTTVVSLAAALGELGSRVLVVDMDPQGSATSWLGVTPGGRQTLESYLDKADLSRISLPTTAHGVDLIASSPYLVAAGRKEEIALSLGVMAALERLPMAWDYVLVDCPPSQVPLVGGATGGLPGRHHPGRGPDHGPDRCRQPAGDDGRRPGAPEPQPVGPGDAGLPCRSVATRRGSHRAPAGALPAHWCSSTIIRDDISLAEAPSFQLPIRRYAPTSTGPHDYRAAAQELLERERQAVGAPRAWTAPAPAFELSAARPFEGGRHQLTLSPRAAPSGSARCAPRRSPAGRTSRRGRAGEGRPPG